MQFVQREIENAIQSLIGKYPILAVTGPRQSGKTTLLKTMFPNYQYVSLEDTNQRSFAADDPAGFLKRYPDKVIFDEVQRVPHLFSYLQTIVDESRQMGQFILSGSQNFHLMERITQSLAGRVAIFKLLPFDNTELVQAGLLPEDWKTLIIKGFYPAIYDRDLDSAVFYANYLQSYIDRDVTELTNVQNLRLFRNFLGLCAARTGQMLNLANLANECGISQPTAKAWLSILESSYIVFQLQPYFENFNKRIVKTPKLYFYDTGLVSFLLGLRSVEDIDSQTLLGSLFENMVVADILKKNYHQYQLLDYWFWRDSNGNEIDLMTKRGGGFDTYEIKSSQTVLPQHFAGLDTFAALAGDKVKFKTLVYGGTDSHDRTNYRVQSWKG